MSNCTHLETDGVSEDLCFHFFFFFFDINMRIMHKYCGQHLSSVIITLSILEY